MTIEKTLERIATALEILAGVRPPAVNETAPAAETPTPVDPAPAQPTAPVDPAPVQPSTPAPVATPSVMPNLPVPFGNTQEMVTYVMNTYTELGPEKGAAIQNILANLGYSNINDVQPAHYADLHANIEALKVS